MGNIDSPESRIVINRNGFEIFFEILGWLRIVASPLLIGAIIGLVIYFQQPSNVTLLLAVAISLVGLTIGIVWATKKWNKEGTMHFISRVSATPELDQLDNDRK